MAPQRLQIEQLERRDMLSGNDLTLYPELPSAVKYEAVEVAPVQHTLGTIERGQHAALQQAIQTPQLDSRAVDAIMAESGEEHDATETEPGHGIHARIEQKGNAAVVHVEYGSLPVQKAILEENHHVINAVEANGHGVVDVPLPKYGTYGLKLEDASHHPLATFIVKFDENGSEITEVHEEHHEHHEEHVEHESHPHMSHDHLPHASHEHAHGHEEHAHPDHKENNLYEPAHAHEEGEHPSIEATVEKDEESGKTEIVIQTENLPEDATVMIQQNGKPVNGVFTINEDGTVEIPADLAVGSYLLKFTDKDGEVIAWLEIDVNDTGVHLGEMQYAHKHKAHEEHGKEEHDKEKSEKIPSHEEIEAAFAEYGAEDTNDRISMLTASMAAAAGVAIAVNKQQKKKRTSEEANEVSA